MKARCQTGSFDVRLSWAFHRCIGNGKQRNEKHCDPFVIRLL
jgi:hypothetical protein